MATDGGGDPGREFRLEGLGLLAVAVVLLAGFAAAFYLGRWYERRSLPETAAATVSGAQDPLAHVAEPGEAKEADESLTYFDTVDGEEKVAEPGREARPRGTEPQTPAEAESPSAAPETQPAMNYFVQVFAGRSRSSAEELIKKLQQQGYSARLQTDAGSGERLYKVQVGYGDEDTARAAVDDLRSKGFPSAFYVTR